MTDINFLNLRMDELTDLVTPWELGAVLTLESNSTATDILLENMLYYFVEEEMFEYACVIRDEINRRK